MLLELQHGQLHIIVFLVPSCVVGISDFSERLVVSVEASLVLLHCVGFFVVFCMSSCIGVPTLSMS